MVITLVIIVIAMTIISTRQPPGVPADLLLVVVSLLHRSEQDRLSWQLQVIIVIMRRAIIILITTVTEP